MAFGIKYDNSYSVPYIAFAFVIGYFINTIGSLLEDFYNFTIGGMPSDNLLKISNGKKYTGIRKVRFYEASEVIKLLKKDVNDENADERKMFLKAMQIVNNNEKNRVSEFNAYYAFSRIVLTSMCIISISIIIKYPCLWKTYLIFVPLFLSWERFRQRGYYYAREILNEYLKFKNRKEQL